MKPKKPRKAPQFASEAAEAEWWYKNREKLGKQFRAAVQQGEAQILTKERLLERIAASKKAQLISIRVPANDLELAREQAAKKGLPYQTYLKSLIHEGLQRGKRKAG